MEKERLVLIDGHAVLYRAFHAFPVLTTPKGELVNAVYGFTSILLTVIEEFRPSHIAVTFDRDKPTFRHTQYVGYKAQREEMPTDLSDQQNRVEEVVMVLNMPIFAVEGFEADDVIGTLAVQANVPVMIVTGDKDALQLVDKQKVVVYMPGRGKIPAKIYDQDLVEKEYGFKPKQIIDLKGLAGDASDNIAGVKGVGPKTATQLLQKFGSVERIYENLDQVREEFRERVAQLLIDGHESAILSKKLATIVTDVPITLDLAACAVHDYDKDKTIKLFEDLGFRSLIKKLPNDDFEQMVQETLL